MSEINSRGIVAFNDERNRQIEELGYTPEHDDQHSPEDLIAAGLCYAEEALSSLTEVYGDTPPFHWPWGSQDWKESNSTFESLERAGALLAAGWDRLMRSILEEDNQ